MEEPQTNSIVQIKKGTCFPLEKGFVGKLELGMMIPVSYLIVIGRNPFHYLCRLIPACIMICSSS